MIDEMPEPAWAQRKTEQSKKRTEKSLYKKLMDLNLSVKDKIKQNLYYVAMLCDIFIR